MSNNYGGKRLGAGRKKRPVQERVLHGATGSEDLPNLGVNDGMLGVDMPPPNEYLTRRSASNLTDNRGKQIYESLWQWLKERDCHLLVNPESLQQYALSLARCEQVENGVHDYGFLAKHPTTGLPIESPYVKVAMKYQKQAQSQWAQIEVGIAERLRYFVDKNANSTDPLDVILNRAIDKAGR